MGFEEWATDAIMIIVMTIAAASIFRKKKK